MGFFFTFFKLYKWYHNHGTHYKWSIKGQAKATTALKMKFSINSSVNVTKSTDSCGFGHIYWSNPLWESSFLYKQYDLCENMGT